MPEKLTPKLIRKLFPDQKSKEIERLNVTAKGILEVGDLTSCPSLIRLDLSQNSIQDTSFVTTCRQIKWLSLANNPVADLKPLQCLTNLQVLNVGHAKLAGKLTFDGLDQLGALILNDNQITALAGLKRLPNLNTLVLKHNVIKELGSCLHKCTALQKLSMAHNQLSSIGDALVHCTAIKELRLNHNAIERLPPQLSINSQLRILDLGDNPIADTEAVKVLASLPWLRNLNLKGCEVAGSDDYLQSILRMLPHLEVVDNQRVAERRKLPKAIARTVNAEEPPGYQSASPGRSQAKQHVGDVPHRKDRTKTASTSAKAAAGSPEGDEGIQYQAEPKRKGDMAKHAKDNRDGAGHEAAIDTREGFSLGATGRQTRKEKKRAALERSEPSGGAGESKQLGVLKDGAKPKKRQRKQIDDRGTEEVQVVAAGRQQLLDVEEAAKRPAAADQGGMTPAHRPPVVGVFEAWPNAKKEKKVAGLARGVKAAALLAAEPEPFSTVDGWS